MSTRLEKVTYGPVSACHRSRGGGHVVKMNVAAFSVLLFSVRMRGVDRRQSTRVLSRISRADWFAPRSAPALESIIISICHSSATTSGRHCSPGMPRARDPDVVGSINQFAQSRLRSIWMSICDVTVTSRAPTGHVTGEYMRCYRLIKVSTEWQMPGD